MKKLKVEIEKLELKISLFCFGFNIDLGFVKIPSELRNFDKGLINL